VRRRVADGVSLTDNVANTLEAGGKVMGEKRKRIYETLLDGAAKGLSGEALYDFIRERYPKASSKKIVRTSLLALTDPHVNDPNILNSVYAIAIAHRMDDVGSAHDPDDDENPREKSPSLRKLKKKAAAAAAASRP
jgi:hypothetical protein